MSVLVDKASCVECCFRFYAVVSANFVCEKTMKNPLFRAYYEETAGIEQEDQVGNVALSFSYCQIFILVSTLMC